MTLSTSYPGHYEVASVADARAKAAKTGLGPGPVYAGPPLLVMQSVSIFPRSPVCKSHVLPLAHLPAPKP